MVPHHNYKVISLPRPNSFNTSSTRSTGKFQDVAGDITITVDGKSLSLQKFPLVYRSGKIRRMVLCSKDYYLSKLDLDGFPGGHHTFELAAKFCYGINDFDITATNVAQLRCAAEYLEMTDEYGGEGNLIARTEAYLRDVVANSIEESLEVLSACEELLHPFAEEVGLPGRCVEALATNIACKEHVASRFPRLISRSCDDHDHDDGGGYSLERWIADLSKLGIHSYGRVISAMAGRPGIRSGSITASLLHYAQSWLKGVGEPLMTGNPWMIKPGHHLRITEHDGQKQILETVVNLLPEQPECSSLVPLNFLFRMLRLAIIFDADSGCRVELERRIGSRLDAAALDDLLLIPIHFDVDTVCRILGHFFQSVEHGEEEAEEYGWHESRSSGSWRKVGGLVVEYLVEVASDPDLSLQKFVSMVETLPDYARFSHDSLYAAVDAYLKAHRSLTEEERRNLCRFIDCSKLSEKVCKEAAANDRLPIQLTVRLLYQEQIRMKEAISVSVNHGCLSSRNLCSQSSSLSAPVGPPRDAYATLRHENRDLKSDIARLKARVIDLERAQSPEKVSKALSGNSLFGFLSKRIERIGAIGGTTEKKGQKQQGRRNFSLEERTQSEVHRINSLCYELSRKSNMQSDQQTDVSNNFVVQGRRRMVKADGMQLYI